MEILEQLGLTKREAEIYQTLLRLGESSMAKIISATGAHPQVVYRAIDSLEKKGLVIPSIRKGRKHIRAEDPRVIEKLEEEKLEKYRKILPNLLSLQKGSDEAIVRVARGKDAVYSLRLRGIKELRKGDTYYVIGASGNAFYRIMGQQNEEVEKLRIKKKIIKKLIAFSSQRKMLDKNDTYRELAEFRYLPKDNLVPSSTNIFKDIVAILIWSDDPIVITVESEQVAESYRQYFNAMWEIAQV